MLAVVYPGLGHVYLRSWLRALLWIWMAVLAAVLFVPDALFSGVTSLDGLRAAVAALPIEAAAALLLVTAFNVVDAYWQAVRAGQWADGLRCPSCGRAIDELDLSFCHWCSEPLPDEARFDDADPSADATSR